MASNVIPVRIAHGWAIAWLDLYQTPAVVAESFTSSVKGFFGELMRGKTEYPNACMFLSTSSLLIASLVNPQNNNTNRLGRERRYKDSERSFAFGSPY